MKVTMERNPARRGMTQMMIGMIALFLLACGLSAAATPAGVDAAAGTDAAAAESGLCGNGSAPDYGFSYDLQQAHWTVGWQDYASAEAVANADVILDRLNKDSIAQTMILILPQAQVGNRVNCAVHFLRYMKLGQPTGERKDNGFVFLIVVEDTRIDVHYGVGLGLPALTAPELTALNRAAEEAYQSNQSMDDALLALVQGFDTVARNKYAPLISPTPSPETINQPFFSIGQLGIPSICGMLCLSVFFLPFLAWMFKQSARGAGGFNPMGPVFRGMGNPFGGSRGGFGGGQSSPPTRGGSGSGRSGRGN
jgi:hypothetical protein